MGSIKISEAITELSDLMRGCRGSCARLLGKKIGMIICGANIDAASYEVLLRRGRDHLDALITP